MRVSKLFMVMYLSNFTILESHIDQPIEPVSLEVMADSMQEYVNLRSMIETEQKNQVPGVDLLQLRTQFKNQAVQVRDFAQNCAELPADSRKNILEAIKEDERYYPQ